MSRWAREHIERLLRGETVSFRPDGRSMEPLIRPGDLCTVAPVDARIEGGVSKGSIVLCEVNGSHYLHRIVALGYDGEARTFLIANNRGRTNGWVEAASIFGRLKSVVARPRSH